RDKWPRPLASLTLSPPIFPFSPPRPGSASSHPFLPPARHRFSFSFLLFATCLFLGFVRRSASSSPTSQPPSLLCLCLQQRTPDLICSRSCMAATLSAFPTSGLVRYLTSSMGAESLS